MVQQFLVVLVLVMYVHPSLRRMPPHREDAEDNQYSKVRRHANFDILSSPPEAEGRCSETRKEGHSE